MYVGMHASSCRESSSTPFALHPRTLPQPDVLSLPGAMTIAKDLSLVYPVLIVTLQHVTVDGTFRESVTYLIMSLFCFGLKLGHHIDRKVGETMSGGQKTNRKHRRNKGGGGGGCQKLADVGLPESGIAELLLEGTDLIGTNEDGICDQAVVMCMMKDVGAIERMTKCLCKKALKLSAHFTSVGAL